MYKLKERDIFLFEEVYKFLLPDNE